MRYADITFNDRNPVKRFLQKRRLRDALSVLEEKSGPRSRVLDFGGGNGELSRAIAELYSLYETFCYEPSPKLFREAEENLAGLANATCVRDLADLKGRSFEYVFCLEVFEHLPEEQTTEVASAVYGLLDAGGTAVIGVPNELFAAALVKGIFRMTRRYGAYDARPANILRAACGRPPKDRPTAQIAPGLPYHFHHLGFDYRSLRASLSETFEFVRQFGSPVGGLRMFNSEVYLILKKPGELRTPNVRPYAS